MLQAPPISILVDQETVEISTATSDGTNKKTSFIEQSLFSLSCAVKEDGPVLLPFDVNVNLDTPTAFPQRTQISLTKFKMPTSTTSSNGVAGTNGDSNGRPLKRQKHEMNGDPSTSTTWSETDDVMEEAIRLAEILSIAITSED